MNFTGLYYAATMDAHVGFESWLERDVAMMLDSDSEVVAFSAQPFWLSWSDVRPDDRIKPRDARAFAVTDYSTFARFRDQAAAAAQAAVTERISSLVGWPGVAAENRAAMRVRRSLISMSSKAGSVLSPYQGWSSRRASMSAWS